MDVKREGIAEGKAIWMEALWRDIRYSFRSLLKSRGFTIVAVLTLALGIGANTAIFSVIQSVLLQPPPYRNAGSLVQVSNVYTNLPGQLGLSPGDFRDFENQSRTFAEMGAYVDLPQGFNLTGQGEPERLEARYATSGFFSLLGIHPLLGRTFSPEEDKPGSEPLVLISHRLWQSHFGSDRAAIGRTLTLDGRGYTLAGVLPAGFNLAPAADLWIPTGQYDDDLNGRVHHPFSVIARLKPHATVSEAQAELDALNRREELAFPDTHKNWKVSVQPMENPSAAKLRPALLVLFGAVGLVLLIACANIVNLLLARNAARQKETALRIALGASLPRLIGQWLTESILLSMLGGVLGILLAGAGLRVLDVLVPPNLAVVKDATLNGWVLSFTAAACLLVGIACALIPAAHALKQDLHGILKEGARASGPSRGQRIRSLLAVCEIALALIPLIGAGLLIRSFYRLLDVDPGFKTDHVLTIEVNQPALPFSEQIKMSNEQRTALARKQSIQFDRIAERIQTLPGVSVAGGINVLPLGSELRSASRFVIEGRPIPDSGARPVAEVRSTSLRYFAAMGIPLRRGRLFDERDYGGQNVIINEAMARRFWPGGDPIGRRINLCSLAPEPCWSPIVGVVGNVHQYGLDAAPTLDVYFAGGWTPYFVIRTASDPSILANAAIEAIHQGNPNLPVTHVTTLADLLADSVSPRKFSSVLLGVFAVLALVLAAVGIYGVMNYIVSLRTREIGIRMALGAKPGDVWRFIMRSGARLVLAGVAAGIAGALALTKFLESLLYGLKSSDPATFAAVAILLASVALLACHVPARRAMRIDPIIALRQE